MSLDDRAAEAQRSIALRFGVRWAGLPLTHLARVATSATVPLQWNYWWHAHYLDAVVDAGWRGLRQGDARGREYARRHLTAGLRIVRSMFWRNGAHFANHYYDDMAWLLLATGRLRALADELSPGHTLPLVTLAQHTLDRTVRTAMTDDLGGGLYWDVTRDFKNVPATAPFALYLARSGEVDEARRLVDWIYDRLVDERTGLVEDGLRVGPDGEVRLIGDIYTYNQGTVLGTLVTLGDEVSLERGRRLLRAVEDHLTTAVADARVLVGQGGGDGGLFTGILARYLALAARDPRLGADATARASRLVLDTANALWEGRRDDGGMTLFSAEPAVPAGRSSRAEAVELSTQLQAWTILEAAAALCAD